MTDNIKKWLDIDNYLTMNRDKMTIEQYEEMLLELRRLFELIINE